LSTIIQLLKLFLINIVIFFWFGIYKLQYKIINNSAVFLAFLKIDFRISIYCFYLYWYSSQINSFNCIPMQDTRTNISKQVIIRGQVVPFCLTYKFIQRGLSKTNHPAYSTFLLNMLNWCTVLVIPNFKIIIVHAIENQ
jgi:hypothetical protein